MGYTGKENARHTVCKGLELLEYRGYDSVGICMSLDGLMKTVKVKGRVKELLDLLEGEKRECFTAIGHTRWATHGAPSGLNAHPHTVGRVSLVHNGIIENYRELKTELLKGGAKFSSETDTEVGAALIDSLYKGDTSPREAIEGAIKRISGSYALAIIFEDRADEIYGVRRDSPLIVAKGENGYFFASDITAVLPFTNVYYHLNEGEIVRITKNSAQILNGGKIEWRQTEQTYDEAKRDGYSHFMEKEMMEEPQAIRKCLSPRISCGLPDFSVDGIPASLFKEVEEIHIVACGSAMHAGIAASSLIESLCGVASRAYIASEYRYKTPVSRGNTLVIILSQSGETADSIASLRHAKEKGLLTFGIVNAVETTIAREAQYRAYTYAGPEIAVATTKGYATQVAIMYLFAVKLALEKGKITEEEARELTKRLTYDVPMACEKMLSEKEIIEKIARAIYQNEHVFYIGRGDDYALAQEAALKLKEISYIHCEAYAAGELKHGTISLIENGTPVIALGTCSELGAKLESNVREVKSRGAYTVLISPVTEKEKACQGVADMVLPLCGKSSQELFFEGLMAVQMIAYRVALLRGCDIDKPRNLAKSVTVE